jgi:C4-dicarboxylate-specific signal transduction histidine kinase
LVRADLEKHRILVQAEQNEQLPQVIGDRIQLQQVLLNLMTNAIDSMVAKDEPRLLCVKSDNHAGGGVKVSERSVSLCPSAPPLAIKAHAQSGWRLRPISST